MLVWWGVLCKGCAVQQCICSRRSWAVCGGALGKRAVAGSGVCAGRVVRAGLWRAGVPGWRLPFRHINPVVAGGKGFFTVVPKTRN